MKTKKANKGAGQSSTEQQKSGSKTTNERIKKDADGTNSDHRSTPADTDQKKTGGGKPKNAAM